MNMWNHMEIIVIIVYDDKIVEYKIRIPIFFVFLDIHMTYKACLIQ
jgi:hypothetical protein